MDVQEVRKLDAYLKRLFGNARIRVVPRPKKDDSAEVYVGEEFVGVLFVDDEDNEQRSYNFQMAILATDLGIALDGAQLLVLRSRLCGRLEGCGPGRRHARGHGSRRAGAAPRPHLIRNRPGLVQRR